MYIDDFDMDSEDAMLVMSGLSEDGQPQVRLAHMDFFNEFEDDFDDEDLD